MADARHNVPTVLVILGATGDLVEKKITPSLLQLFRSASLPEKMHVVGFSRRSFTGHEFQSLVKERLIARHHWHEGSEDFLSLFSYVQGDFQDAAGYADLKRHLQGIDDSWGICTNKLFYLAVPPAMYEPIFRHLSSSGLTDPCDPEEGWTRVIVEKPFGSNEETAQKLEAMMSGLFKEIQIYRIDHYLAKETFQNILAFRFFNNLFEDHWGRDLIEKVHIREYENVGVEDRGVFYDAVGALRDVGQNHLLQMAALVAMDQPASLNAADVRASRSAILETIAVPAPEEIERTSYRAQYEGYHGIEGVAEGSETETYFRAQFTFSHRNWEGVPFVIEAGKRLLDPEHEGEITEIEVVFRHPSPCLCPQGVHYRNSVTFHHDPTEGITIKFWSKKPGPIFALEERTLAFALRSASGGHRSQYTEEYEKLLLDCIAGDQTLFVSSQEVVAMWRLTDAIQQAWDTRKVPLHRYVPDSQSVTEEAASYVEDVSSVLRGARQEIGLVGLGKMGKGIALQLAGKGWHVTGYDPHTQFAGELREAGIKIAGTLRELIGALTPGRRVVWVMIPAGQAIDDLLAELKGLLAAGDTIVDAGNSFYKDTVRREALMRERGVRYIDAGVSGGPAGARHGACVMVGSEPSDFQTLEGLFRDISIPGGYAHVGPTGAGHFTKMVHNGIEYGMMQSLGEGFAILKEAPFPIDLERTARLYNRGSVIESRLTGWLANAFRQFGPGLDSVSGMVAHTGEGEWTVITAHELGISANVLEESFQFRVRSKEHPSFIGRVLSALRNQFGGHAIS